MKSIQNKIVFNRQFGDDVKDDSLTIHGECEQ